MEVLDRPEHRSVQKERQDNMILYTDFRENVKQGFADGSIKTSRHLTELDLAIQYAIGYLGEQRGYPLDVTGEEIAATINMLVGDWVYDSENTYGGQTC